MRQQIAALIALTLSAFTAIAQQGAVRMLYSAPNATFIENPAGDANVVTIDDTSGSIATLQSSIDSAHGSNPSAIVVIHLLRGATYTVSTAGLVLNSRECLVASGAIIRAADASVTVPLIQISSGSTNVSVAGGTLDGSGASINGIFAPAADRVNIDKVVVRNCGLDGILLKGSGNSVYDNELTVTRCDTSGSPLHAGISIQNATQAVCIDNNSHDNLVGIYISCAWATVANNTCWNNTTGIDAAGGNDNVVANNTCNNNGTGIHAAGTKNMIVSNSLGTNTTGIDSDGTSNNFLDNLFSGGNGTNFSSGGTTDNIIAYKAALSASGQNYFYPPLIDNQHTTTTIVNGRGRTDVTIGSTTVDSVQSQYNSARSANPNNVIVLHLTGSYTVGGTPLTLWSNTCVLLNGTIQINASTTASAAITAASGSQRNISISGGTIDGGNLTGNNGINISSASMLQIDAVTLQNFGPSNPRSGGSDVIHLAGGSTPDVVTRCTINGSSSRGIWLQLSGVKSLITGNDVTDVNQDGVDCDSSTSGSVVTFNYCHDLVRYGVFIEQSASHNLALGNVCNNTGRDINLYNNDTARPPTQYNTVVGNSCMGNNGLRNGSTGGGTNCVTSHNFIFNNAITNASVNSEQFGTENYFSQQYRAGGSLNTAGAEVFFNSPSVTYLQMRDSNSGLGVVVQNAATTNNAAIVTATPNPMGNGLENDEWRLVPTDSGYYRIVNQNSGLSMVVQSASMSAGALIVQFAYSADSTFNDEWVPQPVGNGLYSFQNRRSGLYLEVTGGSQTPGTQLTQQAFTGAASQEFSLVEDTPAGAPDFSLVATPSSQSINPGGSTSYTAAVTATNGFSGTVTFSVSGLPSGASGSFTPASVSGSGSSTLNITSTTSTPGGTYTLTVTGTSGSLSHSDTVTLVVRDFTISATPSAQTVPAGSATTYTVNLGNINAFSGTITLSASGLPSGASASFSPASLTAPGSSTLTVTNTTSTAPGDYTVTITGTSGGISHSTTVTLSVTDFSIAATPSSRTVIAGNSTNYTATITAINSFSGTVTFSVTGLPSGASASFNPVSVNGSGSSTMTVTTSGSTPVGTSTLVVKGTSGNLSHTANVTLIVNAPGGGLPAGWSNQDIGAVGLSGSSSFSGGTFTVSGSGSDIWSTADQFQFAYQSVTNDLTITARVVSESGNASFAKAAVMIRESLATNSIEVSVLLTPTNGVAMEVRPTTGAATVNVTGWIKGPVPPHWIRLVRCGSVFTSYRSADGVNWTLMVSTNCTMALSAKAGLAVTSHDNAQLNAAAFDNVVVTPIAFTDRDIGAVGLAGSATYSNGVYTVKGSGADIYGTGDQFNYDSQSDSGDATITARVVTLSSANVWSKSGVMFRETIATNSIYVGLYLTTSNGVSMQFRGTTGGGAVDLARQTGLTAPYWVRLVRSGNTFTGFSSPDGATWTQVGSTNVTMTASEQIGLGVCSHNNAALNTTTFDRVSIW